MGGRRALCQSLNAEYIQRYSYIAHILIDGAVDAPDTLGKMLDLRSLKNCATRGRENDVNSGAGKDRRHLLSYCASAPVDLDS